MQEISPKSISLFNRFLRFPFIVVLRKYILLFILPLLFFLTNLVGLWNIRNIDIHLKNESYLKEEEVLLSLDSVLGENIFLVSPGEIESLVMKSSGFVNDVYVEKNIPFTLKIDVKEYTPRYVGYYSDKCVLFSEEGQLILEVCKDCENSCVQDSSEYSPIYISSDAMLENNKRLIFSNEIERIGEVLKKFGFFVSTISIDNGTTFVGSDDGHTFIFDITDDLDIQLGRLYLIGQKINSESMEFKSLDLRFDRPVMKLE